MTTRTIRRIPLEAVMFDLASNIDRELYYRYGTVSFLQRRVGVLLALSKDADRSTPDWHSLENIIGGLPHPYYKPDIVQDLHHFVERGYVREDGIASDSSNTNGKVNGHAKSTIFFSLTEKGEAAVAVILELRYTLRDTPQKRGT